jgi:hypothetical protein
MKTIWSEPPVLGMAPLFHLDPSLGGPPLVTPDGHWRWEGDHWVALELPGAAPAA